MNELKLIMKTPLSDSDLERFLGSDVDSQILKYSDLKKYHDMNQLLPLNKSYKIILIEYEKNVGHWICMLRYNNNLEIFNSFGTKHDDDDFVNSDTMNLYLGQSHLFLNRLIEDEIKDGEFDIIYNNVAQYNVIRGFRHKTIGFRYKTIGFRYKTIGFRY